MCWASPLPVFPTTLEFTGREKGDVNMTMTVLGQTRATRTFRMSGEIPKYQDTTKVRKIIVSILSSFCVGHHKIVLKVNNHALFLKWCHMNGQP